ncbi:DUF2163 domain-containing protein [Mesorhizobium sp. KR9-304]|uniref:DUF2163 domain-containing protein n=1 Tax=Mesorhizobium sp. KR9-304 TaxID=3156614 RepID=UPI0032B42018
MRDTSAGLEAALAITPTTLCWLGRFVLDDGTVIRVTTLPQDFTVNVGHGSETYVKDVSFKGASLTFRGNGAVPDGEVIAPVAFTGAYDAEDVFVGVFDGMSVTLYIVNYEDAADGGLQLGPYTNGQVKTDDRGKIAAFELRGKLDRARFIKVEELSVTCRSDLGDMRPGYCVLPLYPDDVARSTAYAAGDYVRYATAGNYGNRMFECTTAGTTAGSAPSYDYTVSNTTTDGSAVFTAREAWVRSAVVASVTSNAKFRLTVTESRSVDGWFANGGLVKFTSGANDGVVCTVRKYTHSTKEVELWITPPFTVAVSDTLEIMPGCDKTFAMCLARFANTINFRGENLLPGTDYVNGAG